MTGVSVKNTPSFLLYLLCTGVSVKNTPSFLLYLLYTGVSVKNTPSFLLYLLCTGVSVKNTPSFLLYLLYTGVSVKNTPSFLLYLLYTWNGSGSTKNECTSKSKCRSSSSFESERFHLQCRWKCSFQMQVIIYTPWTHGSNTEWNEEEHTAATLNEEEQSFRVWCQPKGK